MDGTLVKDRYLIQRKLGQGGFAITYFAIDTLLDSRPVVVKVLLEHRSDDAWVLKKFRQEMQALARLDHPGIVAALDSGNLPDGKPFLVMQFVKGVTLRQEITPRGMHLERTAYIVRQLGQALSAAHDSGICHRDVKPENIMLQSLGESEEQAKLLDFGIAGVQDAMASTSGASSTISGSWGYMAPEQFEGRSSPASDVYALGAVAYEMVTGRQLFNADSVAQLIALQLRGVRVKPQDLRPSLPAAAQESILKALSANPESRYARARDFGAAFARALVPEVRMPAQPETHVTETYVQQSLEIAHVLFMDLVGYSMLPIDHQTKYLRLLQRVVGDTPEFHKAELSGQLMSLPTGDGMALVFFGDPVMPARCALSIASTLRQHPELRLRMGLHSGPVYRIADINANSNVAGGGINMAQRIMDCGDAGHILFSASVAETVKQISTWAPYVHDLGLHSVKHGVKVHLYNLCKDGLGNEAIPNRLKKPEPERPAIVDPQQTVSEDAPASKAPTPRNWYLAAIVSGLIVLVIAVVGLWWGTRTTVPESSRSIAAPKAAPEQVRELGPVASPPLRTPDTRLMAPPPAAKQSLLATLKPQGYVSDFANVLDPQSRAQLEAYAGQVEQITGVQMALVTLKSLDGEPIEQVTNMLYRQWGGQKGKDNGIMILLAVEDHRDRIEVGYGLQPVLPNGFDDRILDSIQPLLRQGAYRDALLKAATAIGTSVSGRRRAPASGVKPVFSPPSSDSSGKPAGTTKVNPKDGLSYVWIPPGSFTMGCSPEDNECDHREKPAHPVTITKGFWMGQTDVTVGAWKLYRSATGKSALPTSDLVGRINLNEASGHDNIPIVSVTWEEARDFCEWSRGRLPTEAEWEYAARAGSSAARYGSLGEIAWYGDNSGQQRIDSTSIRDPEQYGRRLFKNGNGPHPVGQKQHNGWNIYDTVGNVWQWTSDWYADYLPGVRMDPTGPTTGESRVIRGGSWYSPPKYVRVSFRVGDRYLIRDPEVGARCVGE